MKLINVIRRTCLWFVIRSLEIELHDLQLALHYSLSIDDFTTALIRRHEIKRELHKAQHEYSGLLPVGQVRIWAR